MTLRQLLQAKGLSMKSLRWAILVLLAVSVQRAYAGQHSCFQHFTSYDFLQRWELVVLAVDPTPGAMELSCRLVPLLRQMLASSVSILYL